MTPTPFYNNQKYDFSSHYQSRQQIEPLDSFQDKIWNSPSQHLCLYNNFKRQYKCNGVRKTASGKNINGEWIWEPVSWIFCMDCGLYHSNRLLPELYLNQDWEETYDKNSAGVLLVKQCQNTLYFFVVENYNNYFGFPKGKVEKNESQIEAAKREFYEETGMLMDLSGSVEIKLDSSELFFRPEHKDRDSTKVVSMFVVLKNESFEMRSQPNADNEITSYGFVSEHNIYSLKLNKTSRKFLDMFYSQLDFFLKKKYP